MVDAALLGASASLAGVALGGGLSGLSAWIDRRAERKSIDAALQAEIAAILSLVLRRSIRWTLVQSLYEAEHRVTKVADGTLFRFPRVIASRNYFATFDALLPKIGLLDARRARDISSFYLHAKSSAEMLLQNHGEDDFLVPLAGLIGHLRTELSLLDEVLAMAGALTGIAPDLGAPDQQPFTDLPGLHALQPVGRASRVGPSCA